MQSTFCIGSSLLLLRSGSDVSHQRRMSLELMRLFLVTRLCMCSLRGIWLRAAVCFQSARSTHNDSRGVQNQVFLHSSPRSCPCHTNSKSHWRARGTYQEHKAVKVDEVSLPLPSFNGQAISLRGRKCWVRFLLGHNGTASNNF